MATPILVTARRAASAGEGRTVTELLLKQGKTVRAMVRNEDERAHALREMGAEVVVGDLLEPADVYRVGSGIGGSTSACPYPPVTWKRP